MTRPKVLLIEPNPVFVVEGRLWAPRKSLENQDLFSRRLLQLGGSLRIGGLLVRPAAPEELPVGYAAVEDFLSERSVIPESLTPELVRRDSPDVIWMLSIRRTSWLTKLGIPTYQMTEVPLSVRMDLARASGGSRADLLRSAIGLRRDELLLRRRLRRAAGVEFNGVAARDAYASLNPRHLTFSDHRIYQADLDVLSASTQPPNTSPRLPDAPMSIAFSGRLEPFKGAQLLPEIARHLQDLTPGTVLHVLGTGALEQSIRTQAPANLVIHGFLDMDEWKQFVRDSVDIVIFPHLQGDPSCTYFEALGCGAAIGGFDNETLTPLVREHAVGWTAPRGDARGLVEHIAAVQRNPHDLITARRRAARFMANRSVEQTARQRVDHLVSCLAAVSAS